MAIALEEMATGLAESAIGPWAMVIGAGAVAVAFASQSGRPIARIVTGGAAVTGATSRFDPRAWLLSVRAGMRGLVDEARTEYEASRRPPPATPDQAADVLAEAARRSWVVGGDALIAPESRLRPDDLAAGRHRDARGRFVPRSRNGTGRA